MTSVPKLLAVQVAHGLTSETRVFASVLANRAGRYDPVLLVHTADATNDLTPSRLADLADARALTLDTGWRRNERLTRMSLDRAVVAMTFLRRRRMSIDVARSETPQVVYSSQQHYDVRVATAIAHSLQVPQIIHLHYNVGRWLRHNVVERLKTVDHVVTVSDFIRRQVLELGVDEGKVTTVHNALRPFPDPDPLVISDLRSSLGTQGSFTFGMIGRLDPGKGHLDAITALEGCGRDDIGLVIVGTGRAEREIRERAARSSASARILLTGQRSDVPDLLGALDAFLHPATKDPCPLAVLEALAAGKAVLAYDDGGLPEMIEHGESGILVPHGDTNALARAMAALRDDSALLERLGRAGRQRLQSRFRPESAGSGFADVVVSVI